MILYSPIVCNSHSLHTIGAPYTRRISDHKQIHWKILAVDLFSGKFKLKQCIFRFIILCTFFGCVQARKQHFQTSLFALKQIFCPLGQFDNFVFFFFFFSILTWKFQHIWYIVFLHNDKQGFVGAKTWELRVWQSRGSARFH